MQEAYSMAERRATDLFKTVVGAENYERFEADNYLEIPSKQYPGRVYRLKREGIFFQEPWETRSFKNMLCVVSEIAVPMADLAAARYLLIVGDEKRLSRVANFDREGLVGRVAWWMCSSGTPKWLGEPLAVLLSLIFVAVEVWLVRLMLGNWALLWNLFEQSPWDGWRMLAAFLMFWFQFACFTGLGWLFAEDLGEDLHRAKMNIWRKFTPNNPRWQRKGGP